MVESKLWALENIAVSPTALTRPGGDLGKELASRELFLNTLVDTDEVLLLGIGQLALVFLKSSLEWGGVNVDDARLNDGVCTDELSGCAVVANREDVSLG